jgi:putative membrane protein
MRCSTASPEKPLSFIVIALIAAVAALAAEPTNADIDFIKTVAQDDMAELELAKLAAHSGNSAEVRNFAGMIVADHARNNAELSEIASHRKIPMPTDIDDAHRTFDKDLANLHGTNFDRRYIQAMRTDNHKAAEFLKAAQTRVSDERLREFIKTTLPVVEQRARMADLLAEQ